MEVTLAVWREAGEWWSGEPYREVRQYLDPRGVRREKELLLPSLGRRSTDSPKPYVESHHEEWDLRVRKQRDEKVAKACGIVYESYKSTNRSEKKSGEKLPQWMQLDQEETGIAPIRLSPASPTLLHVLSGYSFGRGTMLAEEIPLLAAALGAPAVALADPFSLVGCVEFAHTCRKQGIKPLIGSSFEMPEGGQIVLIARSKAGYRNLSRLITECHLDEPRLYPLCSWERLERHTSDLLCLTGGDGGPINRRLTHRQDDIAEQMLRRLIAIYGRSNVFVQIERSYLPWEISVNNRLLQLAEHLQVVAVAGGAITHARREHFPVQDVLVCAERLCTVDEILGRKPERHPDQPQVERYPERALNAERFMRSPDEMAALFADRPDLLANTHLVTEKCDDEVLPARTKLPEIYPDSNHALRELTYAGAFERHGRMSPKLRKRIDHELDRIVKLNFAGHFLVIHDACRWARDQRILFSGRGSVVDSAVAYCLGLSRIDAYRHNLHFDRFLPIDGSKRPDIDIDFEANRRDDLRMYLTHKYGREHVATVSAIGAYCTRGIIREVGKALGLSKEAIDFLAKRIHGGVSPDQLEAALDKRPELRNSNVPRERFKWVFELAGRLMDIPRNIRAHSSGVVISDAPLSETVPVMWSASPENNGGLWNHASTETQDHLRIIQWDKRSAKHFFDKFDILCLRGQDVLSGTEARIRLSDPAFRVEHLPLDDEDTYRAMRSGELIGIPQSASPAMRQAHIRLRTSNLHDASLVQAGIRPGVGGAVKINELIARRRGLQPYSFEHPWLEEILGLTYGVIVFQEQVDQLLQKFCGYSSGDAEDIREAIHKRRREGYAKTIEDQILQAITAQGHSLRLAKIVYDYVSGFQGYGFAQGHALAFAEISIRSIYCQQNFPAPYFAALLDAQPAGYYGPCTLVNEARVRGCAVLPPCVLGSDDKCSVEDVKSEMDPKIVLPSAGIRIGLRQISGISSELRSRIVQWRAFLSGAPTLYSFVVDTRPERDELERLILCGAMDRICPNRRAMLWAVSKALEYEHASRPSQHSNRVLPHLVIPEPDLNLEIEDFAEQEKAVYERSLLGLDVRRHLMEFERKRVSSRGGIAGNEAKNLRHGERAIVVGNPIRLRFPPTKSGKRVVFFDLEDETGLLNVTCFDDVYQKDGHAIICSAYVTVVGEAQDRDGHTAFLAHRIFPYRPVLGAAIDRHTPLPITTGDFLAK
ncbi:MAG TPA: DNA polymerase III subunit alpha [Fimbriimonadaceae bacterium]|nr:DNA polymerase III subunit alpha [Fimbriimonadaceae bacterium]